MPTITRLELVSTELTFEAGEVNVWRHESLESLPIVQHARVRANVIEPVLIDSPGLFMLSFQELVVLSRHTGSLRKIQCFSLPALVNADAIAQGVAQVPVGFHAFIRIEVSGNHRGNEEKREVGVALDHVTIEGHLDGEGGLNVLAPPGSYLAYLLDRPSITAAFAVQQDQEDAGTVTLKG